MASPEELRDKAAQFTEAVSQLRAAAALPVVNHSSQDRRAVDLLLKRAGALQKTIESAGRMIDGGRRWFRDTFGTDLEHVPVAGTAIDTAIQTSIAGMNYFLRDAENELKRTQTLKEKFDALPEDGRKALLASLADQPGDEGVNPAPSKKTAVLILGGIAGAIWFAWRNGMLDLESEGEE